MKKNKIFAFMAAAMTFAACSTTDITDDARNNNYDANAVTVASVTRNTGGDANDDNATTTPGVDKIEYPFLLTNLTQKEKAGYNYEAVFEYTEDGNNNKSWTPKDGAKVMWYGSCGNNFQAYYPCTKKNGNVLQNIVFDRFMIPGYQQNDKDSIPDWMRATATEKRTLDENGNVKPLDLNFEHMLSQVTLVCDYSNNPTIDGKTITGASVDKIFTRVQYCEAETGDDGKVTIKPYQKTDYGTDGLYVWLQSENSGSQAKATAIVAPGAYTNIGKISIYFDNNSYYDEVVVSVPNGITLEAGKHYTFTLKGNISHEQATISSVKVTDWVEGSIQDPEQPADYIPYVTFSAESEQGFLFQVYKDTGKDPNNSFNVDGLQYSIGNSDWQDLPSEGISDEVNAIKFGGTNGALRLRGKNLYGTAIVSSSYSHYAYIKFTNDTKVSCTGDIRTLLDYENYNNVDTRNAQFAYLFSDCTQLTSAPLLPATALKDYCYRNMFTSCTSLETAPKLPATTLAANCYQAMFDGCTSLNTTPELLAESLVNGCYTQMFNGCTNLSSVTMLAKGNFDNCLNWWLKNAGTSAQSRTLKVNGKDEYDKIKATSISENFGSNLPDIWQAGESGAKILDKDGKDITSELTSTNP